VCEVNKGEEMFKKKEEVRDGVIGDVNNDIYIEYRIKSKNKSMPYEVKRLNVSSLFRRVEGLERKDELNWANIKPLAPRIKVLEYRVKSLEDRLAVIGKRQKTRILHRFLAPEMIIVGFETDYVRTIFYLRGKPRHRGWITYPNYDIYRNQEDVINEIIPSFEDSTLANMWISAMRGKYPDFLPSINLA